MPSGLPDQVLRREQVVDNNNPTPQLPVPNTPPISDSSSKKLILWLVIGLVIIIVLVGGIYLFLSRQQESALKPQVTTLQTSVPTPQENLENDLSSIDVDAGIDSDFSSLDQDLKQL